MIDILYFVLCFKITSLFRTHTGDEFFGTAIPDDSTELQILHWTREDIMEAQAGTVLVSYPLVIKCKHFCMCFTKSGPPDKDAFVHVIITWMHFIIKLAKYGGEL